MEILVLTLLTACAPAVNGTPVPPAAELGREIACTLVPQQTGEKVIPLTIGTPPPPQAAPGESISFSFEGGYRITNIAKMCGNSETFSFTFADELADFSYKRTVHVWLDETRVAELTCDYQCTIEFPVPIDLPAGNYRLNLGPPYGLRELEFELLVRDPSQR